MKRERDHGGLTLESLAAILMRPMSLPDFFGGSRRLTFSGGQMSLNNVRTVPTRRYLASLRRAAQNPTRYPK